MSLKRVFGNRSASTVLKRGNSIIRFMKWHRETHFSLCPFPVYEAEVDEYLEHLSNVQASPSALTGFLGALRFCSYIIGVNGDRPPTTIKSKRLVEVADLNRKEKRQARILTIIEVESLEKLLNDEREELADRYAAGAFLFCLYSRSRLSDLRKVRGFLKDVSESNGTIFGYIECRTRSHKTSRLVAHQGLAMPLIAPVWGAPGTAFGPELPAGGRRRKQNVGALV